MCSGSHQMSPVAKSPLSGDRLFFFHSSNVSVTPRIWIRIRGVTDTYRDAAAQMVSSHLPTIGRGHLPVDPKP